jgi:single-strand DNA-binding protein
LPNFNKCILVGHLGQDPETKDGGPTRFSVAVNDRWKDANGEKQERTNWFNVVAWNGLSDSAKKLHKGSAVLVEGSLRENTWIDEDTKQKRSRVEIVASSLVFLSPKPVPEQAELPSGATPITARRKAK